MKITIDTKEDSHEDIRKAISFLSTINSESSTIVENASSSSNIFDSESPTITSTPEPHEPETREQVTSGFVNIFGDNSQSASKSEDPIRSKDDESSTTLLESTAPVDEEPPTFEDITIDDKKASDLVTEY